MLYICLNKKKISIILLVLISLYIFLKPTAVHAETLYDLIGEAKNGLHTTSFNSDPFSIDKYDILEASCYLSSSVNSGGSYWPCTVTCVLTPLEGGSGTTLLSVSAQSVGSGVKKNSVDVKALKGYYYLSWSVSCFKASNGDWCSSANIYQTKAYYEEKEPGELPTIETEGRLFYKALYEGANISDSNIKPRLVTSQQFVNTTKTIEIDPEKKYICNSVFDAPNYNYGSICFIDKGVLTEQWRNGGYDKFELSGNTLYLKQNHPSTKSHFFVYQLN